MLKKQKDICLKNKKVLITGADGFIGSHLVEKLYHEGCDIRAMIMYNSFNSWGWLDTIDKKILKNIEIYPGDIRDIKSVKNACKNIDIVFHLASLIAIPHSYQSPYSYLETNALGALNLFESSLDSKNQDEKIFKQNKATTATVAKPLSPAELKEMLSKSKESDDDDCLMCGS